MAKSVTPQTLRDYIKDLAALTRLAGDTGVSEGFLRQVSTEWRGKRASPELAQSIELHTKGVCRCGFGPGMRADLQWVRDASGRVTGYFTPADKVA